MISERNSWRIMRLGRFRNDYYCFGRDRRLRPPCSVTLATLISRQTGTIVQPRSSVAANGGAAAARSRRVPAQSAPQTVTCRVSFAPGHLVCSSVGAVSVCLCSVRARVRDLLLFSAVNFARRDWTDFHRISYLVIVNFFKFFRRRVRRIWLIGRSTVFGCLHRITFSVVGRQMCVVARLRWVTSRHGARPPETWDARQTGRRRMSVAGRRGTRTVSEGLRDDADGREEQRHRNVVRWQQETGQQQQQRQVPRVRRGLQPGTEAPRQDRILQAGTGRGRDRRVPVPRHVRHTRRHVGHVAATAATVPRVPEGSLSKSFGRGEFFEFETLCLPVLTEPLMALDVLSDNGRASCRVKKIIHRGWFY